MPPPDPLALAMNRPMPLDPNDPTAFMRSIIDAQGRQQIWDTMGGFASGLLQSAAPSRGVGMLPSCDPPSQR